MRQSPVSADEALALAQKAHHVYGKVGRTVHHHNVKTDGPPDAALVERLLLGRSGTLRAPVLQVGTTLVAGWDEDLYRELLL